MTRRDLQRGQFRAPGDVKRAWLEWKCNCAPAAVAALLGVDCADVREAFPEFEQNPRTAPSRMMQALTRLNVRFVMPLPYPDSHRPGFGFCFIQWGGSWLRPGVPIGAAYARTHWIAVDGDHVYDVNEGWIPREQWERPKDGLAAFLMEDVPGCDGTWSIRKGIEVLP